MSRKIAEKMPMPRRWRLFAALAVFLTVSWAAIFINSFIVGKHGWDLSWSISRYVGSETWSAVVFALANVYVGAVMGRYLWRLGTNWGMGRLYYYCVLTMVVALLMLSFCPIGYFDIDGKKSVISFIHELSSRTMFVMMLIVVGMLARNSNSTKLTRRAAMIFLVYGAVWIGGYMTKSEWMASVMLIMESVYITSFMLIGISCKVKKIEG